MHERHGNGKQYCVGGQLIINFKVIVFAYLRIALSGPVASLLLVVRLSFFRFKSNYMSNFVIKMLYYRRPEKEECVFCASLIDWGIHSMNMTLLNRRFRIFHFAHIGVHFEIDFDFFSLNMPNCGGERKWPMWSALLVFSFSFIIYNVQSESVNKGRMIKKVVWRAQRAKLRDR